jgi:hypothetical protein
LIIGQFPQQRTIFTTITRQRGGEREEMKARKDRGAIVSLVAGLAARNPKERL